MDFFRRKVAPTSEGPKVTRSTVKKVTKKAKPKNVAVKVIEIVNADPESYFWVNNGNVLKNLHDLQDALVAMNDEQFDFHTKRDGNDFAKWVADIFGEMELASKLSKSKTKKSTLIVLNKYIG